MWCNEAIIVGGTAGSILLSFKQDARDARNLWQDEISPMLEDVGDKCREISDHLDTARKGRKFSFIVNLHGSSVHVLEMAEALLRDSEICVVEMNRLLAEADEERERLLARISPIISMSLKREIEQEVKLLDGMRGLVNPDRNRVLSERRMLKKELKRVRMLLDEIRIAMRNRYGGKGRDWDARLQNRLRRKRQQSHC